MLVYDWLGLKASLERLQLEYVDVVFANRPDPNTPMEGRWACWDVSTPCLAVLSVVNSSGLFRLSLQFILRLY